MTETLEGHRVLKACDACKARKVRCSGNPGPCNTCVQRKVRCHFSRIKLPRRPRVTTELIAAPAAPLTVDETKPTVTPNPLPELFVDRLLARDPASEASNNSKPFALKGNALFGGNYSLSFFSNSRLLSLSTRLGNNKVDRLVQRISSVINGRIKPGEPVSTGSFSGQQHTLDTSPNQEDAEKWIKLYFENFHPFHPFLDRAFFEATAASHSINPMLAKNKPWCALYHSVLALGCQYDGGGSFEPGKGRAWSLFSISLSIFPDLLALPDSLTGLQALTSMALFASSISCVSIEHVILSEAVRRAQRLGRVTLTGAAAHTYRTTFWVLYSMEKVSSLFFGRSSGFVDCDISCPIPSVPEAVVGGFDWFLTFARHSRLLSRALTSLFSVGVTGNPPQYYLDTIDQLENELEQWRMTVPVDIRPGETFRAHLFRKTSMTQVALWTHYLYNSFRLILSRAMLQLTAHFEGVLTPAQQKRNKTLIMKTSRSILELTMFIDVEPYTSLWVIAGVPIIALFVLFDLVIHNPKHPETSSNLALLDVAGGYFSRIEYASGPSLPGSLVAEFAHIAREYVNNVSHGESAALVPRDVSTASGWWPGQIPDSRSQFQTGVKQPPTPLFSPSEMSLAHIANVDDGSQEATPIDTLSLPMNTVFDDINNGPIVGTDVMDLFNYSIPGIDPIFCSGFTDEYGFAGSINSTLGLPSEDV